MQALAASCEELRARTGNPPLRFFELSQFPTRSITRLNKPNHSQIEHRLARARYQLGKVLPFAYQYATIRRAVPRRDNCGGGGGGGVCSYIHVHIFMFTYRKNNRFQKKFVGQNTNI